MESGNRGVAAKLNGSANRRRLGEESRRDGEFSAEVSGSSTYCLLNLFVYRRIEFGKDGDSFARMTSA